MRESPLGAQVLRQCVKGDDVTSSTQARSAAQRHIGQIVHTAERFTVFGFASQPDNEQKS